MISRSRRIGSHGRDCSQEPTVQPMAPTVSTAPACNSGTDRCSTNINGTKASAAEECTGEKPAGLHDLREAAAETSRILVA